MQANENKSFVGLGVLSILNRKIVIPLKRPPKDLSFTIGFVGFHEGEKLVILSVR